MSPRRIAAFTVEGRPFHVLRSEIVVVGQGVQPVPALNEDGSPVLLNPFGDPSPNGQPKMVDRVTTMVTVRGVGNFPVDETLEQALALWDGYARVPFDEDDD